MVLNLLGLLNILVILDGNVANLKWCKDPNAVVDVYETKRNMGFGCYLERTFDCLYGVLNMLHMLLI